MPHAFIGYAGSTVRAAEMFDEAFPGDPMTVLVDYFAQEVTDSIAVCERFPERAKKGEISIRIDTPGSRFIEGLDPSVSYAVLEEKIPHSIRGYRSDAELAYLVGAGTSAAAFYFMRDALDKAGFKKVKIVGSSGFSRPSAKSWPKPRLRLISSARGLTYRLSGQRPMRQRTSLNMMAKQG